MGVYKIPQTEQLRTKLSNEAIESDFIIMKLTHIVLVVIVHSFSNHRSIHANSISLCKNLDNPDFKVFTRICDACMQDNPYRYDIWENCEHNCFKNEYFDWCLSDVATISQEDKKHIRKKVGLLPKALPHPLGGILVTGK